MLPVIYSNQFLLHDTGPYHPERPERLKAIVQALQAAPWADQLEWLLPTPVNQRDLLSEIHRVHDPRYTEALRQLAERGGGHVDPDTPISSQSYNVALLAVSAWLDGIDQVLATRNPAFVLARPPGHHALPKTGMGFCLFSNAAIAAHYVLDQPGVERVAILDWDVHHGNGTQAIVESHPQIAYCSIHQANFYPGTGAADQRGAYGNVLNLPVAAGSTYQDYQPLFQEQILPFLGQFRPEVLIVSAGYDANYDDDLAAIALQPENFGSFTDSCLQLTRKILFGLEGGYDLPSLAASVQATLEHCLTDQNSSAVS